MLKAFSYVLTASSILTRKDKAGDSVEVKTKPTDSTLSDVALYSNDYKLSYAKAKAEAKKDGKTFIREGDYYKLKNKRYTAITTKQRKMALEKRQCEYRIEIKSTKKLSEEEYKRELKREYDRAYQQYRITLEQKYMKENITERETLKDFTGDKETNREFIRYGLYRTDVKKIR